MNRQPRSHRSRRSSAAPLQNPLIRVLLAALAVLLIVVLCVAATSLMPQVDPAALEPTAEPGTPTPACSIRGIKRCAISSSAYNRYFPI